MAEEKKNKVEKEKKTEEKKEDKKSKSAVEKAEDQTKTQDNKKEESKEDKSKDTKKEEKKEEPKTELEREYVIPLRLNFLKVPRYRRTNKAIKTIKEFLAKHMKVEDRDLSKIKIDMYLNQEVWFRGIKKPPVKIKVKAVKRDGIVYAELAEIPDKVKFDMAKAEKFHKVPEKAKAPKIAPTENEETKTEEEKTDEKEKEKASVEAGLAKQKKAAKSAKHTSEGSHKQKSAPVRKALKK